MKDPEEMRGEIFLSFEDLTVAAGVRPTLLARLIRLGVIEPARPESAEFTAETLARIRRMLRLHAQLGVNFTGAAIILDLLDRLHRLERGGAASAVEARPESGRLPSAGDGP
ncbi:MAG TPA: chaperone modulator CbpM [Candidatus Eisenbacteria bacterium]|nr:chaperone modulator CbpM [Candidatus Eisenbacteria bacterium]